jgi:carbonic anhydrase
MRRGGGDDAFDIDLVRVQKQAHERLAVIGIGFDIGEDNQALVGFGEAKGRHASQ